MSTSVSSPTSDSVSTAKKSRTVKRWVTVSATLVLICLLFIVIKTQGFVSGNEFSPTHFQQRKFSFYEIPLIHPSPAARVTSKKAHRLNEERYHLVEVGGSDAHFLKAIGSAHTEFSGTTANELRTAIERGETKGVCGEHPSVRQLGLGPVVRQQWRGMMATPRQMGWLPTIGSFFRRRGSRIQP